MLVEVLNGLAVDVDNSDNTAAFFHRDGHFGAYVFTHGDVAGFFAHIGHDEGASVEGDPAGDALTEGEFTVLPGFGEPVGNFEFEFFGVGVDQRYRGTAGLEDADDFVEDQPQGDFWVFGIRDEATDPVERINGCVLCLCGLHSSEDRLVWRVGQVRIFRFFEGV